MSKQVGLCRGNNPWERLGSWRSRHILKRYPNAHLGHYPGELREALTIARPLLARELARARYVGSTVLDFDPLNAPK